MRNTPYSVNEHYSYSLDLSKIQAIKLLARRHTAGMRYSISDVMLLPGKRAESISWMKMNKLEFFPFIDKYGQFKHKEWPGKTHNDEDLRQARKKRRKILPPIRAQLTAAGTEVGKTVPDKRARDIFA